jgi:hypothetical protein
VPVYLTLTVNVVLELPLATMVGLPSNQFLSCEPFALNDAIRPEWAIERCHLDASRSISSKM